MAVVLDAFASYVADLLKQVAQDEVGMLLGVSGEIANLEEKLQSLKEYLADAERKRISDKHVQRWVRKLKDVMYDATDILELCQLNAMDQLQGASSAAGMGCCNPLLFCLQNPLFAHDIGSRIKKLNQRLDGICKTAAGFNFIKLEIYQDQNMARARPSYERKTDQVLDRLGVVGEKIEEDTRALVEKLMTKVEGDNDGIMVVAIVGVGGIGKTTLAKKVFNDEAIQHEFDKKIWLSVTQDFNQAELLRTAITAANGDLPGAGTRDRSLLASALVNAIKDKVFFLVLDDMWSEGEWNNLLRAPFSYGAPGSRVLVTTRIDTVARAMQAAHPYHRVDKLGPEDAWSLLKKQVADFVQGALTVAYHLPMYDAPRFPAVTRKFLVRLGDSAGDAGGDSERPPSGIPRPSPSPIPSSTSSPAKESPVRGISNSGGFSSHSKVKSSSVSSRFFGSGLHPASRAENGDRDTAGSLVPAPDPDSRVVKGTRGSARSAYVDQQIAATIAVPLKPSIRSKCFVPGRGCQLRPWKGPLPKRKPSEITLAAFLPSSLVNRSATSEEDVSAAKLDSQIGGGPLVISSRAELIARARVYGASRNFTPRLGPRLQRLLIEPRVLDGGAQHLKPTYAAMASRPPAPVRQPSNHRPPPQFQARPPMQKHVPPPARQRPQYNRQPPSRPPAGRGYGPGRGFGREGIGPPRRNLPHGRGCFEDQMIGQGATRSPAETQHRQDIAPPVETAKAKKPRPPHCFRCKTNGHLADGCKANLDCIICNKNSHLAAKCPILKMPRPGASMFGFAKAGLCFYRLPDFDFKLEEPEPAPTTLVKISGGTLPTAVVQEELARLSRLDWNWEALPHGDDSFLVAFPSEEELLRMADVEFRLKNLGITLLISQWRADGDDVPAYHLDEVWVHVSGVPHALRHFLGFWGLGAAIGATLEVDMLTYRRKGVIRILVGMLDKSLLPLKPDILFGKVGYDITFTLENEDFEPAVPEPEDFDSMDRPEDGVGDQDAGGQGGNQFAKKQKQIEEPASSLGAAMDGGPAPMQLCEQQIAVTPLGPRPVPGKQLSSLDLRSELAPIAAGDQFAGGQGGNQFAKTQQKIEELAVSLGAAMDGGPTLMKLCRQKIAVTPLGPRPVPGKQMSSIELSPELTPAAVRTDRRSTIVGHTPDIHFDTGTNSLALTTQAPISALDSGSDTPAHDLQGGRLATDADFNGELQDEACMADLCPTPDTSAQCSDAQAPYEPVTISATRAVQGDKCDAKNNQESNREPVADEDIMTKAMKRAAARSLEKVNKLGNKTMATDNGLPHSPAPLASSLNGYFCGFSSTPFLGYSTQNGFAGFSGGGLTTFGPCGQGYLLPGIWVAI